MRALAGEGLAGRRLPVLLLAAFGALALLVASVGVYAMFSSMTATREREFGVRMALGSRPHAIAGLVLRQGSKWIVVGLAGGALGIVLVVRLVRDLLFEVSPFDPTVIGAAVVILVGCAAVALAVPVRRATRVDPMAALRAELSSGRWTCKLEPLHYGCGLGEPNLGELERIRECLGRLQALRRVV